MELSRNWTRVDYFYILTILSVFALAVLLTNPVGDFSLNDDWTYAFSALNLANSGRFDVHAINQAYAITHVLIGALAAKIFGSSHQVLRWSTCAVSAIGLVTLFMIVRRIADSLVAFIATSCLLTNALYFQLSLTYMTDVPFVCAISISMLLFLMGMQVANGKTIALGYLFGWTACLNRLFGWLWIGPMSLTLILKRPRKKSTIAIAILMPIACVVGSVIITQVMAAFKVQPLRDTNGDNIHYALQVFRTNPLPTLAKVTRYALVLGWLVAPIAVLAVSSWESNRKHVLYAAFGILVFSALMFVSTDDLIFGNLLSIWGLGPFTLRDALILKNTALNKLPEFYFICYRAVSAAGIAWGLTVAVEHLRLHPKRTTLRLILLVAFSFLWLASSVFTTFGRYLGPALCVACFFLSAMPSSLKNFWKPTEVKGGIYDDAIVQFKSAIYNFLLIYAFVICVCVLLSFDRYALPMSVPLLAVVSLNVRKNISKIGLLLASAMLVANLIFSVYATHDYFCWNRVRWSILSNLEEQQKIPATEIDGGYEFNGQELYSESYKQSPEKSYYWVVNDTYVVAFSQLPKYKIIRSVSYDRWLIPGFGTIFLEQKLNKN